MKKLILAVILGSMLAACKVPIAYRGHYESEYGTAKLDLKRTMISIDVQEPGNHVFQMQMRPETPSIKELAAGAAGALVERVKEGSLGTTVEGVLIEPTSKPVSTDGGIIYYDAKIAYYTLGLSKSDSKNSIDLMYCFSGKVMVDLVSKQWQAGCGDTGTNNVTLTKKN